MIKLYYDLRCKDNIIFIVCQMQNNETFHFYIRNIPIVDNLIKFCIIVFLSECRTGVGAVSWYCRRLDIGVLYEMCCVER